MFITIISGAIITRASAFITAVITLLRSFHATVVAQIMISLALGLHTSCYEDHRHNQTNCIASTIIRKMVA